MQLNDSSFLISLTKYTGTTSSASTTGFDGLLDAAGSRLIRR